MSTTIRAGVDPARLADLREAELARFAETHSRSIASHEQSRHRLLYGVPMNWMTRWPGQSPIVVAEAAGARVRDIDDNEYVDLCLGDTGAMAGHGPAPAARARPRCRPAR